MKTNSIMISLIFIAAYLVAGLYCLHWFIPAARLMNYEYHSVKPEGYFQDIQSNTAWAVFLSGAALAFLIHRAATVCWKFIPDEPYTGGIVVIFRQRTQIEISGRYFIDPLGGIITIETIELTQRTVEIKGGELESSDKVRMFIGSKGAQSYIRYRISVGSLLHAKNLNDTIKQIELILQRLAQDILMEICGANNHELLWKGRTHNGRKVSEILLERLKEKVERNHKDYPIDVIEAGALLVPSDEVVKLHEGIVNATLKAVLDRIKMNGDRQRAMEFVHYSNGAISFETALRYAQDESLITGNHAELLRGIGPRSTVELNEPGSSHK